MSESLQSVVVSAGVYNPLVSAGVYNPLVKGSEYQVQLANEEPFTFTCSEVVGPYALVLVPGKVPYLLNTAHIVRILQGKIRPVVPA